jgi:transposase InsO family protein
LWYSWPLFPGLYPFPFSIREASVDGVASGNLHINPSTLNTSLLYLNINVNSKCMKAMIDTGANRTFISTKALGPSHGKMFINKIHKRVILADGYSSISVYGTLNLSIIMGDTSTSINALVVKELCADCILGMDFINKYKLIINAEERIVSLYNNYKRTTLRFDINSNEKKYPARLINNIRIPPKQTRSIPVSVDLSSANVIFRPSFKLQQRTPLLMLNSSSKVHDHISKIPLYNPTNYSYSLPKGLILGTTTIPTLFFKKNSTIVHELVNKNITDLIQHITRCDRYGKIKSTLYQHFKLFDTSKATVANNVKPHSIKTLDHPPPTSKPYYTTPNKQEEMYKIVQELLYFGLIRPSYSPYAAPALLVPKHDGNWRMVVDYKKLNNITIKDSHPLPNMEQAIQTLGGGFKFFSKLDMKSGFWQIPIEEEDRHKTAFITPEGLYEWNVLAQGLKNSPPSFQRVMTEILSPCRQFALVYIDDIVVYSRSFEEHLQHIHQVLSVLSQHNFQLNPSKCSILRQQIDYLSHTISEQGVKPNNEKIQAIIKLREPSTLVEANKFLGALSWYRKFIPRFASIAASIHKVTNLTKANRKKFSWGEPQREAFLQLKQLLVTSPLFLDYPDDNYPVILTTDASKNGVGGTLQQHINGEIKNLYYHSQMTSSTQRRYDPIELEALAIWMCSQRMRPYLLGRSIIIYTDHCPLCNMMKSSVKNRRVDRISILLQEFNIEKIIHIKGQYNCLADYLSRHPIPREEEIFDEDYGIAKRDGGEPTVRGRVPDETPPLAGAVITRSKAKQSELKQDQNSTTTSTVRNKTTLLPIEEETDQTKEDSTQSFSKHTLDMEQLKIEQGKDSEIQQKITEARKNPVKSSYEFKDGLLYKLMVMREGCNTKTKLIYLPSTMINDLLQVYHNNPLSGHFGVQRTYLKIKNKYWWPNMKRSIARYIQSCLPCQQYNISRSKKPGRLQPISPPEGPFQLIGMDFCGPFKQTPRGNRYVLCITDYFTRWVVAIAVPDCSAQTAAEALFNEYICKYGVPAVILSDQGTHFHNQLMEAMSKLMGYKHTYSTTYHPQSNGMVERFNATFVPQIAKLQDKENNNWDEFLLPVVFAYNTGTHSTTNYSPFQLLYGREPRLPTDGPIASFTFRKPNDYYEQLKKSMRLIHGYAREIILCKQHQYKSRYDKQRPDPHYTINDRVLIRRHGLINKLEPKYSVTPQIIIREEHPVYAVKDEITQTETRVHINDIRPIYISKSNL